MESGNNTSKYLSYASSFVAKMIFFTKGKGLHKDYLTSFELALRDAAISDLNLVSVASIMPPELGRKDENIYCQDRLLSQLWPSLLLMNQIG